MMRPRRAVPTAAVAARGRSARSLVPASRNPGRRVTSSHLGQPGRPIAISYSALSIPRGRGLERGARIEGPFFTHTARLCPSTAFTVATMALPVPSRSPIPRRSRFVQAAFLIGSAMRKALSICFAEFDSFLSCPLYCSFVS